MALSGTARRIDCVITGLMNSKDDIEAAHDRCGVPLDDVICCQVKVLLERRIADCHEPEAVEVV